MSSGERLKARQARAVTLDPRLLSDPAGLCLQVILLCPDRHIEVTIGGIGEALYRSALRGVLAFGDSEDDGSITSSLNTTLGERLTEGSEQERTIRGLRILALLAREGLVSAVAPVSRDVIVRPLTGAHLRYAALHFRTVETVPLAPVPLPVLGSLFSQLTGFATDRCIRAFNLSSHRPRWADLHDRSCTTEPDHELMRECESLSLWFGEMLGLVLGNRHLCTSDPTLVDALARGTSSEWGTSPNVSGGFQKIVELVRAYPEQMTVRDILDMVQARPLLERLGQLLELRSELEARQEQAEIEQDVLMMAISQVPVFGAAATALEALKLVERINAMGESSAAPQPLSVYARRSLLPKEPPQRG